MITTLRSIRQVPEGHWTNSGDVNRKDRLVLKLSSSIGSRPGQIESDTEIPPLKSGMKQMLAPVVQLCLRKSRKNFVRTESNQKR